MPAQARSVGLGEGGGDSGAGGSVIQLHITHDGVEQYLGRVISKHGVRTRLDAVGDRAVAVSESWVGGVGGEGGRCDELNILGGRPGELSELWLAPERRADECGWLLAEG